MSHLVKDQRLYKLLVANIFSSIGSGITMIAIPWLLVNRQGGDQLYGYAALLMTLFLFFVSPYVGVIIDRVSRKKMLLISEVFGFVGVSFFAFWGFSSGSYETWHLIGIYVSSSIYFTFHYPTQFAFNQEVFDRSQYRTLNSVMEIQGQTASMVAGGLASILIEGIDLGLLLLLDASTYIVAFILISTIPYRSTITTNKSKVTIWSNMVEGFLYLKEKPVLILFFICSLMPFIGVMVGNYLWPVYIAKTLQADATTMGLADMMYAIGAVMAGILIPLMINKWGAYQTVKVTAIIFTVGVLTAAWIPVIFLFLLVKISLGFGNAGTRVARNTIMMEMVPNHLIGRVNSFFTVVGLGFRVSMIGLFTQTVKYTNASVSLSIMGFVLAIAVVGVLMSHRLFSEDKSSVSVQTTV